jgi:hypothetical protein
MRSMGCALYIRCALSIHQKECQNSLGCTLYIGARYLLENTVFNDLPSYIGSVLYLTPICCRFLSTPILYCFSSLS